MSCTPEIEFVLEIGREGEAPAELVPDGWRGRPGHSPLRQIGPPRRSARGHSLRRSPSCLPDQPDEADGVAGAPRVSGSPRSHMAHPPEHSSGGIPGLPLRGAPRAPTEPLLEKQRPAQQELRPPAIAAIHSVAAHPASPISLTKRTPQSGVSLRPAGVFSRITKSCDESSPTGATIRPPSLSCA